MCTTVAAAGIPVPPLAHVPDPDAVREFGRAHGWPLVCKPHRGTASRGVVRLDSGADLDAHPELAADLAAEPFLAQTYVDAPILHIDGLWEGDRLGSWTASRYVGGTCADFTQGNWLGSVEEDDPVLLAAVEPFAAAVGAALGGAGRGSSTWRRSSPGTRTAVPPWSSWSAGPGSAAARSPSPGGTSTTPT